MKAVGFRRPGVPGGLLIGSPPGWTEILQGGVIAAEYRLQYVIALNPALVSAAG